MQKRLRFLPQLEDFFLVYLSFCIQHWRTYIPCTNFEKPKQGKTSEVRWMHKLRNLDCFSFYKVKNLHELPLFWVHNKSNVLLLQVIHHVLALYSNYALSWREYGQAVLLGLQCSFTGRHVKCFHYHGRLVFMLFLPRLLHHSTMNKIFCGSKCGPGIVIHRRKWQFLHVYPPP